MNRVLVSVPEGIGVKHIVNTFQDQVIAAFELARELIRINCRVVYVTDCARQEAYKFYWDHDDGRIRADPLLGGIDALIVKQLAPRHEC